MLLGSRGNVSNVKIISPSGARSVLEMKVNITRNRVFIVSYFMLQLAQSKLLYCPPIDRCVPCFHVAVDAVLVGITAVVVVVADADVVFLLLNLRLL